MHIQYVTPLSRLLSIVLCLAFSSVDVRADESNSDSTDTNSKESLGKVPAFSAEDLEFFEKQVRPLLVTRCYECHQSSLSEPKGDLRLDSRQTFLAGGDTGPAAVPGSLEKSLFIDAIRYGDIYQMPPKSRLPAEEVAILEQWVTRGMPWPEEAEQNGNTTAHKTFDLEDRKSKHWSWQPRKQVPVPKVSQTAWPASDIDHFILAKLEQNQLSPAPSASKSVLLRRVYFDLIGLPPTVEDLQTFLADESPEALSRVIDRLLESPQFGERWGRHWLDLVRYAESRGHEFDYTIPNVWQYRDYVIRAFNEDVPYDQFVKEHVAGDLLKTPRLHPEHGFNESILGTGFWFLGEWVHSPVDIRKDETDRHDNMINVFSKTFLALTVSCARCHDHKFDAISQADYYALAGYLRSSHYGLTRFETMQHNQQIAKRLNALDAKFKPLLAEQLMKAYEPVLDQLDKYLIQANEVIRSTPEPTKNKSAAVTELLGDTQQQQEDAIKKISKDHDLQSTILHAWVDVLKVAQDEPDHPLHAFAIAAREHSPEETAKETFSQSLTPIKQRWAARQQTQQSALSDARVLVDYSSLHPNNFIRGAVAFGQEPTKIGSLVLGDSPRQPIRGIERFGAARRPELWSGLKPAKESQRDGGRLGGWIRAGQTLYTPSFELQSGRLFYLVQGKGRIYATVDSHVTNNGPLHGRLVSRFDTKLGSSPQWVEQNLSEYIGHVLHIEFSAEGQQDCSVLMVVEADHKPADLQPSQQTLAQAFSKEMNSSISLAKTYQQLFQELCKEIKANKLASQSQHQLTPDQLLRLKDRADLADWLVTQSQLFTPAKNADLAHYQQLGADYVTQRKELTQQIRQDSQVTMSMVDGSGYDEQLLIRGNSRTPGDPVPRRFLTAFGGKPPSASLPGSGRLQLAEQMVAPDNPFLARVMVNRLWHHLLGRGLVASVDNFGVLGEQPTHPDLLDHLANKFIKDGWSNKQAIREIMLTSTYQMASQHNAQADQQDPSNLLWHRAQVRRLEGEVLRDALLAVSGHLDLQQFGPSVPIHLTNFLQGRGRPASGPVDGKGRRSIYLSIRRNFLSPMMLAFDMPIPFTTMGKRNVSNVPAQALILMNDPLVVEQSHKWAERLLAKKDESPEQRIKRMYQTAFARLPNSAELSAAQAFLQRQATELNLSPEQASNHPQLWADLGHVLFNAKEFIYLQ